MQSYKLAITKNGKKYTIVFKAETERQARERVHKEWYSILSVEEITVKENLGNMFMFSAYTKEKELKNWKIVWEDIFKAYVKLKKDLEYDVTQIFSEKDIWLYQISKDKILNDLEEEYKILYWWTEKKRQIKKRQIKEKTKSKVKSMDNFYLKKELEEVNKLIEIVLLKMQNLIWEKTWIELDVEQKEKIKNVFNNIIKIKNSTNIAKLREVWEIALLKVWEIELAEVEKKHKNSSKKLLKETNVLLKKIGSKQSFVEKEKDVWYKINNFFWKINNSIKTNRKVEKKEETDKFSHSYVKNILFLKKYKAKLKESNVYILKNFIKLLFNKELRLNILIRRKVIKQNIIIFKAKEKGLLFSYTYLKTWISNIHKEIFVFIKNIKQYLFSIIFSYTLIFIIFLNLNYYFNFHNSNYNWIFFFIVLFFVYLVLYLTRNLLFIFLNFVILFFIVIFWVVNF